MYFVDIGNYHAHLFNGKDILDLSYEDLFKQYIDKKIYYINVNPKLKKDLSNISNWIDLEPFVKLDGSYDGMGVDRKVLLNAKKSGIFVDAGSAITIDKKENGKFIGGTILPGIWRIKKCYKEISPILEIDEISEINLDVLPNTTTKDSISYGIIAPIVSLIKSINSKNLPIYCCGGDGEILSRYIDAKYDKFLLFRGMQKIKESLEC